MSLEGFPQVLVARRAELEGKAVHRPLLDSERAELELIAQAERAWEAREPLSKALDEYVRQQEQVTARMIEAGHDIEKILAVIRDPATDPVVAEQLLAKVEETVSKLRPSRPPPPT